MWQAAMIFFYSTIKQIKKKTLECKYNFHVLYFTLVTGFIVFSTTIKKKKRPEIKVEMKPLRNSFGGVPWGLGNI
jgi:hypothetical protein